MKLNLRKIRKECAKVDKARPMPTFLIFDKEDMKKKAQVQGAKKKARAEAFRHWITNREAK